MNEQIDIYYKPLNKFNIQDKYYNVYLNKNSNLYFPFLNNIEPISKITISLNDSIYKEFNNSINNLKEINKKVLSIYNELNSYINNQEMIINKINTTGDNNG